LAITKSVYQSIQPIQFASDGLDIIEPASCKPLGFLFIKNPALIAESSIGLRTNGITGETKVGVFDLNITIENVHQKRWESLADKYGCKSAPSFTVVGLY